MKLRVGVVFGGRSAEHEVSVASARNVLEAMDPDRYEPVPIGIDREGRWHLEDASRLLIETAGTLPVLAAARDGGPTHEAGGRAVGEVALVARGRSNALVDLEAHRDLGTLDVIFPVLHGPYGEDGSVQGLCRVAGIPCVGAGVLGSAVGMDKDVMKRLLRDACVVLRPQRRRHLQHDLPCAIFGESVDDKYLQFVSRVILTGNIFQGPSDKRAFVSNRHHDAYEWKPLVVVFNHIFSKLPGMVFSVSPML